MTEKQGTIISVLIGMLIPLLTFSYQVVSFTDNGATVGFTELALWGLNILFFWLALLLACILYTRVRNAAVTGACLAITIVYVGFFCHISNSNDPKSGALWLVYFLWSGSAFVFSMLPACFKPKFLIDSARNSFLFSMVTTFLLGVIYIL